MEIDASKQSTSCYTETALSVFVLPARVRVGLVRCRRASLSTGDTQACGELKHEH